MIRLCFFNPNLFTSKDVSHVSSLCQASKAEKRKHRTMQSESTTGKFYALNFMLRVMKGKHKFWVNATYCELNYANEFSIDFPFSLLFGVFQLCSEWCWVSLKRRHGICVCIISRSSSKIRMSDSKKLSAQETIQVSQSQST